MQALLFFLKLQMVNGFDDGEIVYVGVVSSLGKAAIYRVQVEDKNSGPPVIFKTSNQSITNSCDLVLNQTKTNNSDVMAKKVGLKRLASKNALIVLAWAQCHTFIEPELFFPKFLNQNTKV